MPAPYPVTEYISFQVPSTPVSLVKNFAVTAVTEVEKIKELKKIYAFQRATTTGKDAHNTDGNVRESAIFWVENTQNTQWIYDRIM